MKQFFKKLNEPFPESETPKENVINVLGVGIFITFFLYFFQVGGMNNYDGNAFLMCLNFGLITIVVALTFDFFVGSILKVKKNEPTWTLKKWIIYMFILLILISQANYAYYSYLAGFKNIGWADFWAMIFYTVAVGIFPVVFSGLIVQIKSNERNQIQAADLQTSFPKKEIHHEVIHLFSENKSQDFQIPINDIFYIEAMQNYVSVCYLKNEKIQKELLRNTLKNLETQLNSTVLIRCHRSFIVNSDLIKNVEGNAQGLRLSLENMDEFKVPVSRKYIPLLKKIIN
ncbi:MAG: LytR/AlgR family response regulator transcription factor [Saprospiraceae bacterium]